MKTPFSRADLEVGRGFAIWEGGRSMLVLLSEGNCDGRERTYVDLSTSPLRVCLCGIAMFGGDVFDGGRDVKVWWLKLSPGSRSADLSGLAAGNGGGEADGGIL